MLWGVNNVGFQNLTFKPCDRDFHGKFLLQALSDKVLDEVSFGDSL